MKFLDTSFLIDLLRKNPPARSLMRRLDKDGPHAANTLVVHEFLAGAFGAKDPQKEKAAREKLLSKLVMFNFDLSAANQSARIEAGLRKKGTIIGGADVLIVGSMLSRGIETIVTRNTRYFEKIDEISIETW